MPQHIEALNWMGLTSTVKPTRDGYKFLGWSLTKSSTTAEYGSGVGIRIYGHTTLYAVWQFTNQYTITYNANGGAGAPAPQTKTHGVTLTLSGVKPTRTGYEFLGWATTSNATTAQYNPGGVFTTDATTVLYAVWKLQTKYLITYNAKGGIGAPPTQEYNPNTTATISAVKPTYGDYIFMGWTTSDPAYQVNYPLKQPGETFLINWNWNLYALWGCTVKYDLNGGAGIVPQHIEALNWMGLTSTVIPTRSGYKFLGWSLTKGSTTKEYGSGVGIRIYGHTTLYAVWQAL